VLECRIEAGFLEAIRKLPNEVAKKAWKSLDLFSKNPQHPGLHLEQLQGKARGLQSIRVDDNYRLIVNHEDNFLTLLYVGTHDSAYREAERKTYISPPVNSATVQTLMVRTRKYLPLAHFLLRRVSTETPITLSFAEIERIIGSTLPPAARKHRAWWANDKSRHSQANAWLAVGWKTASPRLAEMEVTFVRS